MLEPLDWSKDKIKLDIILDTAKNCNVKNKNNNLFVCGKELCNFEKKGNNNY